MFRGKLLSPDGTGAGPGPITAELAALLSEMNENVQAGQETANPPPPDGLYAMRVLRQRTGRTTGNPTRGKAPVAFVAVSLEIVDPEHHLSGYRFSYTFFNHESSMGRYASFAACSLGRAVTGSVEAFAAMQNAIEQGTVFVVEVSRKEAESGGEFVNLRATGIAR